MKKILVLVAAICVMGAASAKAALLNQVQNGTTISVYLDASAVAGANGQFDTVIYDSAPDVGSTFAAPGSGLASGAPRPAGQASTYRNRVLDLDPTDVDNPGGLGWSIVGASTVASALNFTGGPLGLKITTPPSTPQAPGLFLANYSLTGVGSAHVQIVSAGTILGEQTITLGIPEPATVGLASMALLGLVGLRRRK
jgi:hypothetical protein